MKFIDGMRNKIIERVFKSLRKDSPIYLWNFLCQQTETPITKHKLTQNIMKRFPDKAKKASYILETFINNKYYEDFYRNIKSNK